MSRDAEQTAVTTLLPPHAAALRYLPRPPIAALASCDFDRKDKFDGRCLLELQDRTSQIRLPHLHQFRATVIDWQIATKQHLITVIRSLEIKIFFYYFVYKYRHYLHSDCCLNASQRRLTSFPSFFVPPFSICVALQEPTAGTVTATHIRPSLQSYRVASSTFQPLKPARWRSDGVVTHRMPAMLSM